MKFEFNGPAFVVGNSVVVTVPSRFVKKGKIKKGTELNISIEV